MNSATPKDPIRVIVGRLNWLKRRPWTQADRQRQAEYARQQRPWQHSTGPRTLEGKQRIALNGLRNRPNPESLRQMRLALRDVTGMERQMAELRRMVAERDPARGHDDRTTK